MKARKPKPLSGSALFDYAARALAVRALSQGELRARLKARAERAAEVEEVLGRLKRYGYLDDRRFAETYSRLRRENQGFGRFRVLRDLRARRVAPAVAEKAVAEAYRDVDETEMIERFLRRKLRYADSLRLDDPRRVASLYRALLRAGFTSGKILETLRKLAAEPEWVEGLESAAGEEASD